MMNRAHFPFPFSFSFPFLSQRAQGAELNKRRRDGMSRKRAKKACRPKAAGGIALRTAPRRFRFSTGRLCAEPIPFCNAVRPSKPPLQSVRTTLSPDNRQVPETMRPARRQEETACSLRAPPCGKQTKRVGRLNEDGQGGLSSRSARRRAGAALPAAAPFRTQPQTRRSAEMAIF